MRQRKEKLLTNAIPKKNNADADKVLIRLLTICHASNNKLYIYIYIYVIMKYKKNLED